MADYDLLRMQRYKAMLEIRNLSFAVPGEMAE